MNFQNLIGQKMQPYTPSPAGRGPHLTLEWLSACQALVELRTSNNQGGGSHGISQPQWPHIPQRVQIEEASTDEVFKPIPLSFQLPINPSNYVFQLQRHRVAQNAENAGTSTNGVIEASPVSFKLPNGSCKDIVITNESQQLRVTQPENDKQVVKKKRGETTIVYKGDTITFELPEDYIEYILDMEELAALDVDNPATQGSEVSNLPLFERLDGWSLEKRQRSNGRCDVYYHHEKSKWRFRSFLEVGKFIISRILPPKRYKLKSKEQESNSPEDWAIQPLPQGTTGESSSGRKRKYFSFEEARSEKMEELIRLACKKTLKAAVAKIPRLSDDDKNKPEENQSVVRTNPEELSLQACEMILLSTDSESSDNGNNDANSNTGNNDASFLIPEDDFWKEIEGQGDISASRSHSFATADENILLDIPIVPDLDGLGGFLNYNRENGVAGPF